MRIKKMLAVLRENKLKGAKGGYEPCPASAAGPSYI